MASTSTVRASGTAPDHRKLNGPQTTGREYRSLSEPEYGMRRDDDVPVPMRDGVRLLADVHQPDSDSRFLRCRTAEAVPPREPVNYRIPLVPNARRFAAGHCIRLVLTSDDQPKGAPAIMEFRHAPVGTSTTNTISSASRLLFPVLDESDGGLDA